MGMSRAALLPAIGDPLLSLLWIQQYKKNVQDHIHNLYVVLNSSIDQEIMNYTEEQFREVGLVVSRNSTPIGHGEALKELVLNSTESVLLLLEDDCFVISPNAVDRYFRGIDKDEFDLVGSLRMSCSSQIADIAQDRWGLDYAGEGDRGCAFWPNCLFVKRADLMKTDLDFGAKMFPKGSVLLGHILSEDVTGDTLVWLSLQLRNLGVRINEVPQYHCSTYDANHYYERKGIFDGQAPWVHTGSSSSLQSLLSGSFQVRNASSQEKMEYERRLAWWKLAYDLFREQLPNNIKVHVDKQLNNMHALIRVSGFSNTRISTLVNAYRGLVW